MTVDFKNMNEIKETLKILKINRVYSISKF